MRHEAVGWWACTSCGITVPNNHSGPCFICNGRIGRMVPNSMRLDADIGVTMKVYEPPPVPVEPPSAGWNHVALVAAAVLCIASPLVGASSAGWNAAMAIMALNIWSSSIGYYALRLVHGRDHADARAAAYA